MSVLDSFAKAWKELKKTAEIFIPNELTKLAYETKFIQRSTNILQAKDCVDLLSAASTDPKIVPLTGLCNALRELNAEADLTPQSLMGKINNPNAAEFLKQVFCRTMEAKLSTIVHRIPPDVLKSFKNVWLEDCSECVLNESLQDIFKGSGGQTSKASVKIDLIYEIKQKTIHSINLVDRGVPDQKLAQKNIEIIQSGDLIIRDLGFFDVNVLKVIKTTGAFFLIRLPAGVSVYLNQNDEKPVDLAKYINQKFPNDSVIDVVIFITAKKFSCRLIAYRAPQEISSKRRREAHKSAQKRGRTPKAENLNRLDFSFFLTNVPGEVWPAEVVGTIYTVRWQIELIFKSWKSGLQINYLKGINEHRIRCLLYAKLTSAVIFNAIYNLFDWYAQQLGKEISLHKVINWLKQGNKIGSIIMYGLSSQFMVLLINDLPKTLCKDKRRRKSTQSSLEHGVSFEDLYVKYVEDKQFRVA